MTTTTKRADELKVGDMLGSGVFRVERVRPCGNFTCIVFEKFVEQLDKNSVRRFYLSELRYSNSSCFEVLIP